MKNHLQGLKTKSTSKDQTQNGVDDKNKSGEEKEVEASIKIVEYLEFVEELVEQEAEEERERYKKEEKAKTKKEEKQKGK